MNELPAEVEEQIANMAADDFAALVARTRPPEETDPKARAAAALRRHRGTDRATRATKEDAAAALHRYRHGDRD